MNFIFGARRSVASITSALSVMIEDLANHAATKIVEAETLKDKITTLQAQQDEATAEITRAKLVSTKISSLLS